MSHLVHPIVAPDCKSWHNCTTSVLNFSQIRNIRSTIRQLIHPFVFLYFLSSNYKESGLKTNKTKQKKTLVRQTGDEQRQGCSSRNNGWSLSAARPDIHEPAGSWEDGRPSAENTGDHRSLPVITHADLSAVWRHIFSLSFCSLKLFSIFLCMCEKTTTRLLSHCPSELQHFTAERHEKRTWCF